MPSSKRTRERHLAKLAARRAADRRRKQRNRIVTIALALMVAVAGIGVGAVLVLRGNKKGAAASKASPSPSPSPGGVACGGTAPAAAKAAKPEYKKAPPLTIAKSKHYTLTMQTSCGSIVMELQPATAPNAVNSIVFLVQHHFYDGLTFHRIAKNFVIQGGDPKGNGSGGPGYTTVDTPPRAVSYPQGSVAMAKTQSEPAGTAGSQFFIVTSNTAQSALAPKGQPQYALVGRVTSGMGVVQRIAALPIQGSGTDGAPVQSVYIDKATIEVS